MNRFKQVGWTVVLLGVAGALLFGDRILGGYVDWLWFGEVGQRGVFWRVLGTQVQLALVFGLALAALLWVNLQLAYRSSPPLTRRMADPPLREQLGRVTRAGVRVLIVGGSLAVGLLGALEAATHWDEFLRFRHPQPFGMVDPVFHRDVGFYLFTLPFWKYLYGWSFIVLGLATAATALVYFTNEAIKIGDGVSRVAVAPRVHLSVLLGLLALVLAWGYRIDAFDLLYQDHGRYFGAGYTDIRARLVAINILTVVALVAAGGFFVNAVFTRALVLPGLALALIVVASFTVGTLYPTLIQNFRVRPNEANLERPFIANHLRMTRAAFGLDRVEPRTYALNGRASASLLRTETPTLENIRLWDYRALAPTYRQLQGLRDYYDLSHIDLDRYRIGGRQRQVMLAARELNSERIANPTWVNQTLLFTHGYGLVMNPVSEVTENGQPAFAVGSLPLQAVQPDLIPRRPQLYFGEQTTDAVIAPSQMEEFDFALEQQREVTRYAGGTGLPVGSWWHRSVLAAYMRDSNFLLSSQITPESRLLIRRRIDERAARIAPFLTFDHDPYLVVGQDGLYWIQDAYTVSDQFPYSQPVPYEGSQLRRLGSGGMGTPAFGAFNYLRNSVKVVVDAYTGRTDFYVFDPSDPLVRAYQAIFPGLLKDASQFPAALREHVRYPEDLFATQTRVLSRFHIQDPLVFYNQTSFWALPRESLDQGGENGETRREMEPYYVMMRLPGEAAAEYVLIQPFVFKGQQNMAAWMAARCSPEHLGEMRLFTFNGYVKGPELIEQAIQSKPSISSELTLLNREGSRVVWGNLLVLPLADTLLYVRPLYLAATTTDHRETMREFQRVVVANEQTVVMAASLDAALAQLFNAPESPARQAGAPARQATGVPAATPPTSSGGDVTRRAVAADEALRAAREALGRGDWTAFGQQMDRAQRTIQELRRTTEGAR